MGASVEQNIGTDREHEVILTIAKMNFRICLQAPLFKFNSLTEFELSLVLRSIICHRHVVSIGMLARTATYHHEKQKKICSPSTKSERFTQKSKYPQPTFFSLISEHHGPT
jgi:hypothetical protein